MFQNPLPAASGTTILGIWLVCGIAASVTLRHFGLGEEATLALSGTVTAVGMIAHPQVNRSVPVSPDPPNDPLPTVATSAGEAVPVVGARGEGEGFDHS